MIRERLLKSLNLTLFSDFYLFISEYFPFYKTNNEERLLERLNSKVEDLKVLTEEDKIHFLEYVTGQTSTVEFYLQSLIQFKNKYKK